MQNLFFSGEGIVYHLDELTGALLVSHKLAVSSKDFPGKLMLYHITISEDTLQYKHTTIVTN